MTPKSEILPVVSVLLTVGAIVTYTASGEQKVVVAVGFTSILWSTEVVTGKVVILGLGEAHP